MLVHFYVLRLYNNLHSVANARISYLKIFCVKIQLKHWTSLIWDKIRSSSDPDRDQSLNCIMTHVYDVKVCLFIDYWLRVMFYILMFCNIRVFIVLFLFVWFLCVLWMLDWSFMEECKSNVIFKNLFIIITPIRYMNKKQSIFGMVWDFWSFYTVSLV